MKQNLPVKVLRGGLVVREFSWPDWILLGSYLLLVTGGYLLNFLNSVAEDHALRLIHVNAAYYYAVGYIVAQTMISSAFVVRLRNILVSVGWLMIIAILCVLNPFSAILPLVALVLYHIIRAVFWQKYAREFIPCDISKYGVGKLDLPVGILAADIRYMKMLFYVGMLIFVLYTVMLISGQ